MTTRFVSIWTIIVALACIELDSIAWGDWTSFRAGGTSRSDSKLPVNWAPQDRIAWQHELPGYGQSTPVVSASRLYVTAVEGTRKEVALILCYELDSGKEVWRFGLKSANDSPSNYMASRAAPTPVVDAHAVYAFFETGNVVAVSLKGQELWQRDLTADHGKFDNNHGLGSSPAQNESHLFLNIEHKGPSYLIALDKLSGETAWRVDRESGSSWSSPIVANINGTEQLIVSSAGSVTGYDPKNGNQLWTVAGIEGNTVPSPTAIGSRLFIGARLPEFAVEGSVRNNCCIDLSAFSSDGPKILWRSDKALSDYCSPVHVGEVVYLMNKGGILYCLDSETGSLHYTRRLGTECWGTPIVAGDLVYFFGKDGKTLVVKAGADFEVVSTNILWDEDSPPRPEQYVEFSGDGHGHGGSGNTQGTSDAFSANSAKKDPGSEVETKDSTAKSERTRGPSRPGGPGGGMMAAMMAGDKNGDGVLQSDEISADFKPMLPRIDTNQDGSLDAAELKAMAESFAARRADSQAAARDPIVYGAAASEGRIVIRTGTRLYCIQ